MDKKKCQPNQKCSCSEIEYFFKTEHKIFLINRNNGEITMKNQMKLPVGQTYFLEILARTPTNYNNYDLATLKVTVVKNIHANEEIHSKSIFLDNIVQSEAMAYNLPSNNLFPTIHSRSKRVRFCKKTFSELNNEYRTF